MPKSKSSRKKLYYSPVQGIASGSITVVSDTKSQITSLGINTVVLVRMTRKRRCATSRTIRRGGGYTVDLALSDGIGEILSLELYAASEAQASLPRRLPGYHSRSSQVISHRGAPS